MRVEQLEQGLLAALSRAHCEATSDALLAVSPSGVVIAWNSKLLESWRLSEDELRDAPVHRALGVMFSHDGSKGLLCTLHHPDGRAFEARGRPIHAADGRVGTLWCMRDVSGREDFLATAGHELRTPLSALQLTLDQLRRKAQDSQLPEWLDGRLEASLRQTRKLERLVRRLIEASRVNGQPATVQAKPVDLSSVAKDVVETLLGEATRQGCAVALHAAPAVCMGDADLLAQVLTNLLSNAIKYGERRPVIVSVQADGGDAVMEVVDHGLGIAPKDRERIFERFERLEAARPYGGLGLGLFVVRELVRLHGGRIEVEGAPGMGTTFRVRLPQLETARTGHTERVTSM